MYGVAAFLLFIKLHILNTFTALVYVVSNTIKDFVPKVTMKCLGILFRVYFFHNIAIQIQSTTLTSDGKFVAILV